MSSTLSRAFRPVRGSSTPQALPFLVPGTVLAGVVPAYLRPALVARLVPHNQSAAVGAGRTTVPARRGRGGAARGPRKPVGSDPCGRGWNNSLANPCLLSILAMAILAVLLAVCSEADALLAAVLRTFSPTTQLAFMVVGPVVDLKLIALQPERWGRP